MQTPRRSKRSKILGVGSSTSKRKLTLMDLPLETQKEIFKHVPWKDLPKSQLVNKHFHSLASARLYSVLKFTLTHSDGLTYYTKPATRLADLLHTFAISEHDYGQYVKTFRLELSDRDTEEIQKKVLSKYHFEEDAARLLNTTLLLMLRKAHKLEVFVWDTSIELSGHVYEALGKMRGLHELYIRLDTLPIHKTGSFPITTNPTTQSHVHAPPVPPGYPAQPTYSVAYPNAAFLTPFKLPKELRANPFLISPSRRRFSGFGSLRQLGIAGIDELDCLTEIAQCVAACSATLKTLTISLSHELARRARKPSVPSPPVNLPTDSDLDDDDDDDAETLPASHQPSTFASQGHPANEADIRKEKAAQDFVLAKIFGLEAAAVEGRNVDKHLEASACTLKSKDDVNQVFMEELKKIMTKLIQTKSTGYGGMLKDKNILELLEKAAEKYLASGGKKHKKHSEKSSIKKKISAKTTVPSATASNFHSHHLSSAQTQDSYDFIMSGGNPNDVVPKGPIAPPPGSGLPYLSFAIDPSSLFYDEMLPGSSELAGSGHPGSIHVSEAKSPAYQQAYAQYMSSMTNSYGSSSSGNIPPFFGGSLGGSSNVSKGMIDEMKKAMYEDAEWQQHLAKVKQHKVQSQANATDGVSDTEESEIEENGTPEPPSDTPPLFPAAEPSREDREDAMDIDMEHPDVIDSDDGEDQVLTDEVENGENTIPDGPGAEPTEAVATASSSKPSNREILGGEMKLKTSSFTKLAEDEKRKAKEEIAVEDTMQGYIRTKHGFHLEELSLYLIPLKASVLGKALDLTCLRRITLLNVGSQGGFWTLVARMQKESLPIQFQSIHTDDVSLAFLNCLGHFDGVEDLFMMKRSSKEPDSATSKTHASLTDIRLLALRKHITTLKRLVVMNNDDDSWDADAKWLRLLTAKGAGLEELAISSSIKDYHILMQNLPGLKNLKALHILAIRTDDQCASVVRECRKFTIDNITHCPTLKIRYLAMTNMVFEIARKPKFLVIEKIPNRKGKGKAKATDLSSLDEPTPDSDDFSEIESGGLEMAVVRQSKFCDVSSPVRIFQKDIRTGKL